MKRSSYMTLVSIAQLAMLVMFMAAPTSAMSETIHITKIEQLKEIAADNASYPLNGEYVLDGDINASATSTWDNGTGTPQGFIPIGTIDKPFSGSLDGKGHVISGLYINRTEDNNTGLFGYVSGELATILNVGLDNATIIGGRYTGALVGYIDNCLIKKCYTTGSVSATDYVGGLVGRSHASTISSAISNCYSTSVVTGDRGIGGLVGYNDNTPISACYSAGKVSGVESRVGGLIGVSLIATASDCFWDINTSGQTTSAGGTGKSTADMWKQSTFTNAKWDFNSIWGISENLDYPFLRIFKILFLLAKPDVYHTVKNHELKIQTKKVQPAGLGGVLDNDTDPNGDNLTAIYCTKPMHGTFEGTKDGAFIYNPQLGFSGNDTFWYKANNGDDNSTEVMVKLFVDDTITTPVAVADSYIDKCEYLNNQDIYTGFYTDISDNSTRMLQVLSPGVFKNDIGKNLKAKVLIQPSHGAVDLKNDGSFIYIPDKGFLDVDSFTYSVAEGGLFSSPAVVKIAVNPKNTDYPNCPDKPNCPLVQILGEDSSEIETLRRYRDEVLATSAFGRAGIHLYYRMAPFAAVVLVKNERMQRMVKNIINHSLPGIRERLQEGQ